MSNLHRSLAFTLSELLISLAILGLIATFTIPRLLISVGEKSSIAILKETVGVLSDITVDGINKNDFSNPIWKNVYFASKLNASKICDTDAVAQGCHTGANDFLPGVNWFNAPAIVLPSGAVLFFGEQFFPQTFNSIGVMIDTNGSAGPSQQGKDQYILAICTGPLSCNCCSAPLAFYVIEGSGAPGTIGPSNSGPTRDVWRQMWK